MIGERIDLPQVFRKNDSWGWRVCPRWYCRHGDAFAMRDPLGIRPGFYFEDDEVVAVASERAPLMTVFEKKMEEVSEIDPGSILVIQPMEKSSKKDLRMTPQEELRVLLREFIFHAEMILICREKNTRCITRPSCSRSWEKIFQKVYSVMSLILRKVSLRFMEQLRLCTPGGS